jgi:hypothetical protein
VLVTTGHPTASGPPTTSARSVVQLSDTRIAHSPASPTAASDDPFCRRAALRRTIALATE